MRRELQQLLVRAGVTNSELDWTHVVMLRSSGAPSHPHRAFDRHLTDRGFHFLVLSESGALTHYCKCRPVRPDGLPHWETRVLEAFARDAEARHFVPPVVAVTEGPIELQVARYVDGVMLNRHFGNMDLASRLRLVTEVLGAADALSRAALADPAPFGGPFPDSSVVGRAQAALARLEHMNVPGDALSVVRDGLTEAGTLPAVPQHGDLWPENVLRTAEGGWCILDLDGFGEATLPLYDALHLIRTTEDSTLERPPGTWIEHALATNEIGVATRRMIEREQQSWSLDDRAVGGAVLFYVLNIAAHIQSRGAPEAVWGRFRDEIPAAARRLQDAGSLARFGAAFTTA